MAIVLPAPPRLSGEPPEQQLSNISNYLSDLSRVLRVTLESLNGILDLGPITTAISNPPTQAQVTEIRDRYNGIVAALEDIRL